MRLIELLMQTEHWNDDVTVYVERPWSCDAEAILVSPAPNVTLPVERQGRAFDYFLETSVAREVMDGYATSDEGAGASQAQRCERLIGYAENDA